MKYIITLVITLFSLGNSFAQVLEPVKWETKVEKLSDTEYNLVFKASIKEDWHIYSQNTPEGGPLRLEVDFQNKKSNYDLIGNLNEGKTYTEFNQVFGINEIFFSKKAKLNQKIKILNTENKQIEVELFYQVCKTVCINETKNFTLSLDGSEIVKEIKILDNLSKEKSEQLKLKLNNKEFLKSCNDDGKKKTSLGIFFLGFLGGLLALLTPCVFPMIPLTVSFFTKQSEKRGKGVFNAILYGVFIVTIYLLLSIPFHLMDSVEPEILNNISTNVWLNTSFFIIFLFFAGSFFGYYELTLPNSWVSKMDNASNVGGIIGIFFMALTLALVSFSCTGPILGSLLAGSLSSDGSAATQLTAGMAGFGAALAFPFALFAMFPKMMNSLPKSGGWLNTTKVVLGFLELALAFKFLSKADLVSHWGILKREVFIGIWIIVFIGLALYLLGKIKFPHDSPIKKLSFSRVSFGILVIAFVIYLIPGLTNTNYANLKLISGFPPPLFYSLYEKTNDCPLGLDCYKDFDLGVEKAKKVNKPILLDFTGWGCENCRKMEESVWSDSKIFEVLNNDFILISLYVDDRKQLSENAKFNFLKADGYIKKIETVGDKWSTFQAINFKTASQPDYRLLSPDLELLNCGINTASVDDYYNWLQKGLKNFKK